MQTILGSGGVIGVELAKALKNHTDDIRLVSRHPESVHKDDQLYPADLTEPENVVRAVEGSDIVYLTVGLPYSATIWETNWPAIMSNVIHACRTHQSKLVFFDNIYMYDPKHLAFMTENTPMRPASRKGMVRKNIATVLMDEVEKGNIQALIARSADFYGPSIKNTSILTEMVFANLAKGKKAYWIGSPKYKHSFTYTPDAGEATALLGNTPDAYNQVWHLPTAANPPTGKEWVEFIANEMGKKPGFQATPKFIVRLIGLFIPIMREMVEMMYQYDRDYVFDSTKFEKRFNLEPTPYMEGIRNIVRSDYNRSR